jgi:hypothetical protein
MISDILKKSKVKFSEKKANSKQFSYEVKSLNLNYFYLGHRDYAHGSSMLEGMLKTLALFENLDDFEILNFRVIKQFSNLSYTEAFLEDNLKFHPNKKQAVARLRISNGKQNYICLLFPKNEKINERLTDYKSPDYIKSIKIIDKGKSQATFQNINDFIDLIRALNEGNRQITLEEVESDEWKKKIRWAYIENLKIISDMDCRNFNSVEYTDYSEQQISDKKFVIKNGLLISEKMKIKFKICFFIQVPNYDKS